MKAPDDVKEALAAIGFEANDVSPADEPAYTEFRRGKEFFHVCFAVEIEALSINDVIEQLDNKFNGAK